MTAQARARAAAALRAACAVGLCLVLLACGGAPERADKPQYYTVRAGDTLYSIAFKHGLDYRDVARWNHIANPSRIYPGQRLALYSSAKSASATSAARKSSGAQARSAPAGGTKPAPASPPKPAGPPIDWRWPASGEIVARFGDRSSVGKGIDISGRLGDDVKAAADGRVVYTGSGLIGYGKLIIIKHSDTWLSAYGHNDALFVEQGVDVRAGQRVATMGEGPGKRPLLHFEIRLDGKPVDPLSYLPPR
jgi:lipoprotein NlpD